MKAPLPQTEPPPLPRTEPLPLPWTEPLPRTLARLLQQQHKHPCSTITWVYSGGNRGVQASRMEDWNVRMDLSTMANPADSTTGTIDLDKEMDLSLDEVSAMEEDLANILEEEDRDRHNQEQDRDRGMGGN